MPRIRELNDRDVNIVTDPSDEFIIKVADQFSEEPFTIYAMLDDDKMFAAEQTPLGFIVMYDASIVDELLARFSGFEALDVRFPFDPKDLRPKRTTKRAKKCVSLPYEGPPLKAMWVTHHVDLHPSSTVEIEKTCASCGSLVYGGFVGVATAIGEDIEPRKPNCGLIVSKDQLKHCDFFQPRWTGLRLCTDSVKQFIERLEEQHVP